MIPDIESIIYYYAKDMEFHEKTKHLIERSLEEADYMVTRYNSITNQRSRDIYRNFILTVDNVFRRKMWRIIVQRDILYHKHKIKFTSEELTRLYLRHCFDVIRCFIVGKIREGF